MASLEIAIEQRDTHATLVRFIEPMPGGIPDADA
jgi:hypothetical protein